MEFRQIRYALSVAKERSFTRASNRLNISQSAVSAQIRLLEGEIGFPLFLRSTRGVELTESGRTFLYEAERLVGDLLNLGEIARRLRGGGSETLNLGMVSGAGQTFIPRIFRRLSRIHRGHKAQDCHCTDAEHLQGPAGRENRRWHCNRIRPRPCPGWARLRPAGDDRNGADRSAPSIRWRSRESRSALRRLSTNRS